ncbi:MAG TPA: prepilin-type N-terminal cleavage/methylation domain-containing protein [Verrucomicrobiae bacterium]|nr:prepilin-type N-terminal cleavage/methylation domain-containing protein [Verrucomicrobiae bacterium]
MKQKAAISSQRSAISETAPDAKLKANSRTLKASSGFSLVEVTIALAVMAIGLVAILGLLPRGVQSSRNAADNTLAATIAHDVFNAIRTQPFTAVSLNAYGFGTSPYNLQNAYPGLGSSVAAYFDQSGLTPETAEDDYFRVDLSFQPHTLPTVLPLSTVTATVFWPAKSGMTTFLNTNVFVTEIANYQ